MDRSYWDQLVRDLGEYIQDEIRDAQYYKIGRASWRERV